MSEGPSGITAITLFTDDLEASKDFYGRAFGLPVHYEDAESAVFKFGGTMINLLRNRAVPELIEPAVAAPSAAGARSVMTVAVDDVDALCEMLRDRGVALINGPMDRPWGPRTASFADPSGHIWEVAQ
jgi:catechol 2,3-dioxygenase-like lactoylglutathione lyase family enzyme